jgi:peptidoglycan hydrolase-like protein with peptidoglycan-binding domain
MTSTPDDPAFCGTDQDDVPDHEAHRVEDGKYKQPKARVAKVIGDKLGAPGACAVPGVSLTNYSQNAQQKGWGAPCTQARTTIKLSNGVSLTVASRIATLTTTVLNECIRRGYVIRDPDTGAYNCRYISGTTVWSNHAWGVAIDINWQSNPYTSGTTHDIPDWMAKLLNRYGFAWGGDYTGGKRDYMHFEFMGTPAQADLATALATKEIGGGGGGGQHPPADPHDEVLTFGDSGESVKVLQATLNRWYPKLSQLDVDGDFGQSTFDRVVYFQTAAGLTADGEVGPASRAILGLQVPSYYDNAPPAPPVLNPNGGIASVYNKLPQETKDRLGALVSGERQTANGGWAAGFAGGIFYWTPWSQGFVTWGAIKDAYWNDAGGEGGPMGYPTSHEFTYNVPDQATGAPHLYAQSNFEHGYIVWDSETNGTKIYR